MSDQNDDNEIPLAAGNGLMHRRSLLKASALGLAGGFLLPAKADWNSVPGAPQSAYGSPSKFADLQREQTIGHPFGAAAGSSSTPLQSLNGTITPNSLHFERHHAGIPDIDPAQHFLTLYGDLKKSLRFSLSLIHI